MTNRHLLTLEELNRLIGEVSNVRDDLDSVETDIHDAGIDLDEAGGHCGKLLASLNAVKNDLTATGANKMTAYTHLQKAAIRKASALTPDQEAEAQRLISNFGLDILETEPQENGVTYRVGFKQHIRPGPMLSLSDSVEATVNAINVTSNLSATENGDRIEVVAKSARAPVSKPMDEHTVQFEMNRYLNTNTELEGKPDELAERFATFYEEENWTDEEMAWLKRVAAGITEADASKSARAPMGKADASAFPPEDDKLIEDAMQRLSEYEAAAIAAADASRSGDDGQRYMAEELRAAQACVTAFDALKARRIAADPGTLMRVNQARLLIKHYDTGGASAKSARASVRKGDGKRVKAGSLEVVEITNGYALYGKDSDSGEDVFLAHLGDESTGSEDSGYDPNRDPDLPEAYGFEIVKTARASVV